MGGAVKSQGENLVSAKEATHAINEALRGKHTPLLELCKDAGQGKVIVDLIGNLHHDKMLKDGIWFDQGQAAQLLTKIREKATNTQVRNYAATMYNALKPIEVRRKTGGSGPVFGAGAYEKACLERRDGKG